MKRSLCCDCETPIKLNPSNMCHAILELLLVKKYYDKSLRKQSRNWNANLTEVGALDTDIEADYNEQQSMPVDVNDMADPSVPRINLEELLDDMVLDDVKMSDA
ncbi:hypothetical protein pipiens_019101 [Culex pipiens pipiens]|uniref:Uncharacterized protein n=1 Tax=Culex pipiens pipiens TaxID=38569 RepID=A0ABD1DWA9_CULPP